MWRPVNSQINKLEGFDRLCDALDDEIGPPSVKGFGVWGVGIDLSLELETFSIPFTPGSYTQNRGA